MGYSRVQRIDLPNPVDLGANTALVWLPTEDMVVYGWGLQLTEAIHTATVTTAATVTFAYDAANAGTTVVKGTVSIGTAGSGLGFEVSDVAGAPFKVTGGSDALEWTLTTVISATTTTGVAQPFVYAEVFPAVAPA
jgi:hypothetical protein